MLTALSQFIAAWLGFVVAWMTVGYIVLVFYLLINKYRPHVAKKLIFPDWNLDSKSDCQGIVLFGPLNLTTLLICLLVKAWEGLCYLIDCSVECVYEIIQRLPGEGTRSGGGQ